MKQLLILIGLLSFGTGALAQQMTLSPGKYLLIEAGKDEISTRECAVYVNDKKTFINLSPVSGSSLTPKPVMVVLMHDSFEFFCGPSDLPSSNETGPFGRLFIGSATNGQLRGFITEVYGGGVPFSTRFLLYKL